MARREALLRLHKSLTSRRTEILKKLSDEMDNLRNFKSGDATGDAADVAFEAGSDEMASQLAELDSRELSKIERVGRLNALPYTTLCIECQREMEQYPNWDDSRSANWEKVYDAATPLEDQREVDLSELEIDLPK